MPEVLALEAEEVDQTWAAKETALPQRHKQQADLRLKHAVQSPLLPLSVLRPFVPWHGGQTLTRYKLLNWVWFSVLGHLSKAERFYCGLSTCCNGDQGLGLARGVKNKENLDQHIRHDFD